MNANDILKYGHKHVLDAIDGLSDAEWDIPEVTTSWSVRDVIGHLAAYELLLEDAFRYVLEPGADTPTLAKMQNGWETFNDSEAAARRGKSREEILVEYHGSYERVMVLLSRFTPERLRETGTIPWYGNEYSLDDFIVYASYAHKREHTSGISLFRKRRQLQK